MNASEKCYTCRKLLIRTNNFLKHNKNVKGNIKKKKTNPTGK